MAEYWYDIVDKAAAPIGGIGSLGKAIEDIVKEISKEEGYVIFDIEREVYANRDENGEVWDTDKFTVITGDVIDSMQDIISHNKGKVVASLAITFFDMIQGRVGSMIVIPCVEYKGEEPKLDFVNAFKFNGTK